MRAAARCKVSIALNYKGKTVGTKRKTLIAGAKTIVPVKLKKAAFKALKKRGKIKVKAAAVGTSGGYRLLKGTARITVKAPR